jgi:hypothetical protein
LTELASLASDTTSDTVEQAMAAMREMLGMDVAFISSSPKISWSLAILTGMRNPSGGEKAKGYLWGAPFASG